MRSRLSDRLHETIETLLKSSGSNSRKSLFRLEQDFQDDKDLVHAFVQNDGLACLIKVASENDQNFLYCMLRALDQIMSSPEGMNGVIEHNETIQWLYSLVSSENRLVVKAALKLLYKFVEYQDSNCHLLLEAINIVDSERGAKPWYNIITLLNDKNCADMEMLTQAMALVNLTLKGLPDQDTFYDVVDSLEEQGMERIIQHYLSKQGIEVKLRKQFVAYEAVLRYEDGDAPIDSVCEEYRRSISRTRARATQNYLNELSSNGSASMTVPNSGQRKSIRHSISTVQPKVTKITSEIVPSWQRKVLERTKQFNKTATSIGDNVTSSITTNTIRVPRLSSSVSPRNSLIRESSKSTSNGTSTVKTTSDDITPGFRRRRERDARHNTLIKQQSDYNLRGQRASICSCSSADSYGSTSSTSSGASSAYSSGSNEEKSPLIETIKLVPPSLVDSGGGSGGGGKQRTNHCSINNNIINGNGLDCGMIEEELNKRNKEFSKWDANSLHTVNGTTGVNRVTNSNLTNNEKSWMMFNNKAQDLGQNEHLNVNNNHSPTSPKLWSPLNNISSQLNSSDPINCGATLGVKSIQEQILKSPSNSGLARNNNNNNNNCRDPDSKDCNNRRWNLNDVSTRPLLINDLDFTDLKSDDDLDIFQANFHLPPDHEFFYDENDGSSPIPPPPPPMPMNSPGMGGGPAPPPPPPPSLLPSYHSGPKTMGGSPCPPPPPVTPSFFRQNGISSILSNGRQQNTPSPILDVNQKVINKNKKTVKLFWREVKEDKSLLSRLTKKKTIWDDIKPVAIDSQKLEHLFENRPKELPNKKTQEGKKNEVIVLDTKRSNAINIGMTKLPPPKAIKIAIMKMDSTIMNREGIEKILSTMMPTEDEKTKIAEAQLSNPDVPLGSAENFLLTLASISDLEARLKLWAFKLDYDTLEEEIAEQLMDLKNAIEEIEKSETFRIILSTLLSVGNFLNGAEVKGFQIEYLSKVPEVKDTVHKHSLLHHLCNIVLEKFPKSSDLYSEFGAVTRAYKIDFDEVHRTIQKLESDCKSSWDYLKVITKHEEKDKPQLRSRMSDFLLDCGERIAVLKIVHRRVMNRFRKLLIFLGYSSHSAKELRPHQVFKTISEFALEYRTTRERVKEQIEKKANNMEKIKTKSRAISETDISKPTVQHASKEQQADQKLRKILDNGISDHESDPKIASKWGSLPGIRMRRNSTYDSQCSTLNGKSFSIDGDDEILEILVKSANSQANRDHRNKRKTNRYTDRKFCDQRTLAYNQT
ncbi:formin homology 2 domain containing [Brevipalpus obovatus]|uniref:formin homology 2 domain containing n=1 Tax=Brevipalpus obovatus TaxID=246614 RepID=UPI003D9DF751